MSQPVSPSTACLNCGRSVRDCDASHARGWDGCCMRCDEKGRLVAHRLHAVTLSPPDEMEGQ